VIKRINRSMLALTAYPWPPNKKFLTKCSHPRIRTLQWFTNRWYSLERTEAVYMTKMRWTIYIELLEKKIETFVSFEEKFDDLNTKSLFF
jgi:hypothetical protein